MNGCLRGSLSVVGTWLLAACVCAQLVRPNIRHIDSRQGLSSEQVNAMVTDHNGHLWIGTGDGLDRFDGRSMMVFRADGTPNSLPDDHVNALALDRNGLMYVGCNAAVLGVWDLATDRCRSIPVPRDSDDGVGAAITALLIDTTQRVWFSFGGRDWSCYDPRNGRIVRTRIRTSHSQPAGRNHITRALSDAQGYHWLSTQFGVVRFDPRDHSYTHFFHPAHRSIDLIASLNHVHDMFDEGPSLIVATSGGLYRLDKRSGVFTTLYASEQVWDGGVVALAPQEGSRLWAATTFQGLLVLDRSTGSVKHCDRSLSEHERQDKSPMAYDARVMYRDPDGNVWIGTGRSGIALIAHKENRFKSVALPPTTRGNYPHAPLAFVPWANDHLVVISNTEGAFVLDSDGQLQQHITPPATHGPWDYINDVKVVDGTILMATYKGVYRLRLDLGRFERPDWARHGPLADGKVSSLESEGPRYWMRLFGRGIVVVDTTDGSVRDLAEHIPGIAPHVKGNLRLIWRDAQQRIWLSFVDKPLVVVYPDRTFITIPRGSGKGEIPDQFVTGLVQDREGGVWASTWSEGLFRVRSNEDGTRDILRYNTRTGLPSNVVYHIAQDEEGNIWGATKTGLFRLRPKDGDVLAYGRSDGLPDMDRNLPIAVIGSELHVSFTEGYMHGDLSSLTRKTAAPRVHVARITVFDAERWRNTGQPQVPIALEYDEHQLGFWLHTTNLVDPLRDRIAHRLIGSDSAWSEGPAQERITFEHLPPASYLFQVKARTADGPWSAITSVPFTISPPWWATVWGRIGLLLLLAAAAWLVIRAIVARRLRTQRILFERDSAIAKERIRIARDMHDDLGSGLSVIKVKSEIALLREQDPVLKAELKRISEASDELIDNMRQMVWSIGGGQESLGDLLTYLRRFAAEYLEPHGISCHTTIVGQVPELRVDAILRRELLLLVKEALHNVVKHAHADRVDLRIDMTEGLHITLTDNGEGRKATALRNGHGMGSRTMQARAGRLGATCTRTFANGTTVALHLPMEALADRAERPSAHGPEQ